MTAFASIQTPRKPKLCIAGFAPTSRALAEDAIRDPDYEVWTLNDAYVMASASEYPVDLRGADRWFDLHSAWQLEWDLRRPKDHLEQLAKLGCPVYLIEPHPRVPNSVAFPLQEIVDWLSARNLPKYLTSSATMLLALALVEGWRHILITGIHLETESEYFWQRPAFEYFVGYAQGIGVEIVLPDASPLLTGPIYGRGMWHQGGEKLQPDQIRERLKETEKALMGMTQQWQDATAKAVQWTGKLEEVVMHVEHLRALAAQATEQKQAEAATYYTQWADSLTARAEELERERNGFATAAQEFDQQRRHFEGRLIALREIVQTTPHGGPQTVLEAMGTASVPRIPADINRTEMIGATAAEAASSSGVAA